MDIEEIIEDVKSQKCTEAFACGTAAIIAPIDFLAEETGEKYPFKHPEGKIGLQIREALLSIQEGRSPDRNKWVSLIEPKSLN